MHERTQEFAATVAEEHDITVDVTEFESGTATAADAAEAIGCDVAQIASSLVFLVDDEPVLVVASGASHVSENRLADSLGGESVTLANPDTVEMVTGYQVGGVPPLAHEETLPTVIDETLLDHETVWAAAGTSQTVFPVDPDRLVALTGGTVESVGES